MSALTSLLVRDGVVPVRKIEEALQRQVIAGGDVETVLLEMDAVAENVLAAYRASLHGLAPASRAEVMTVAPEVVKLVPAEVALEHKLIPLALRGRVLEVATRAPLRPEQEEALGFLLGYEVQARLATEVRVAAGLAHHYGAALSPRFTRLLDRLRKRDAGPIPSMGRRTSPQLAGHTSDIPYKSSAEARFDGRTRPLAPLVVEPAPPGDEPARVVRPRRTTSRGLGAVGRTPVAGIPDDDVPDGGPTVFPSTSRAPIGGEASTWASEPPPPPEPRVRSAPRPALEPVSAPLTLAAGEGLLKRASSRDQILDVLLSFARQHFDYTALFVVHDEVADGREAAGVGASTEEVQSIAVPLDRPSAFAEVRRLRAPLVLTLGATETEREVLLALRRAPTTSALLLPIAIRQRVVLLVYGDRDGEEVELGDVMELVRFASRVADALEQLILRKKRVGYHTDGAAPASSRSSLKQAARAVAQTAGRGRPSSEQRRDSSAWRAGHRATEAAEAPDDSWSSVIPDQPPAAVVLPSSPPPARRVSETSETLTMPAVPEGTAPMLEQAAPSHAPDAPPERVLGIPRSAPPPPPVELELSEPELAVDVLVERAKNAEPSSESDDDDDDDIEIEVSETSDEDDFEIEIGEADEDFDDDFDDDFEEEPARFVPPERKPGTYKLRGGPIDVVRPSSRPTAGRPHDEPRPTGDDDAIARIRASLRPPPRGPDAETRSVIVDMGEQVHAQVEDLLAARDDAHRDTLIRGLLYMGEAALPALVQAFPGPLNVSRDTRPVPVGRDVSVVARALVAFGERAVPYVAALLSSGEPDVRFYAALVAGELVHPDLMEAVAARIYDADPDVRRLACALLPRFAGYRGFDEIRVVTRRAARLRGKDPTRRWQALDALVALRDVESVERTIELLLEDDAELVDHAHRALVILTCADHGRSHRRWRAWFEKHGAQHRIEWLIEGLLHAEESVRALAGAELERLTQERYGYHAGAPKRDRERAHRSYRRWWEQEGARRYG